MPLYHLKLILTGGRGRTGSKPRSQIAGSLKALGSLGEGVASRTRPGSDSAGGAGGGRKPAGTPSPSREGPGNRGGAPAGRRRQGLRLRTRPRGVWNGGRATPLAPTPLIPPDSGKSGRPGVSQGYRGRVPCLLGVRRGRMAKGQAPRGTQFLSPASSRIPLHLQKKPELRRGQGSYLAAPGNPTDAPASRKRRGRRSRLELGGNSWDFQN